MQALMERLGLRVDVWPGQPPYIGADPVVFVRLVGVRQSDILTFPVRAGSEVDAATAFAYVLGLAQIGIGPFLPVRRCEECCRALDTALGTIAYLRLITELTELCPLWRTAYDARQDLWGRTP